MNDELIRAISELDEDRAVLLANKALDDGESPTDILDDCNAAMAIVGDRFEKNEYYLAELMMSGEILERISGIVKPRVEASGTNGKEKGRIVIGTVRGDVHNIGKDIVIFMLEVGGYTVYDLGIDVPEEKFVQAIREKNPQMVCLSGLLTAVFPVFRSTIDAIKEAGLRDRVKIAVGGGQVDDKVLAYTGADGYGSVASMAVTLANQWISS
ncbi:MAG: cobalamin-dependent protein [Clostridiales Family XIII bacterium]|jgi:5-methyltetrahydrofolate--homocysteine methyltransferase|nr:cobalamin-dependent protein [Clostridiales Family XIII bacterium]